MLQPTTIDTLIYLIDLFAREDVFWIIGGHTGLILQGVRLEDDLELDICTFKVDAYRIAELLNANTIEEIRYVEKSHLRAYHAAFRFPTNKIELMGDPEIRIAQNQWVGLPPNNICRIEFEDRPLNVFTLESEYRIYNAAMWKPERNRKIARKIKERLEDIQY